MPQLAAISLSQITRKKPGNSASVRRAICSPFSISVREAYCFRAVRALIGQLHTKITRY
jgi:hypothetical protein